MNSADGWGDDVYQPDASDIQEDAGLLDVAKGDRSRMGVYLGSGEGGDDFKNLVRGLVAAGPPDPTAKAGSSRSRRPTPTGGRNSSRRAGAHRSRATGCPGSATRR